MSADDQFAYLFLLGIPFLLVRDYLAFICFAILLYFFSAQSQFDNFPFVIAVYFVVWLYGYVFSGLRAVK